MPGRTSALQAAALGVPKPLRQLILHIRHAWSTHKHPTPNPGPPQANVRSAVSFLEFKFENSNGWLMDLAGDFFQIPNRKSLAETGIKILGISVVLWNCNRQSDLREVGTPVKPKGSKLVRWASHFEARGQYAPS